MSDHTIELARRLAELGEKEGAQKAYFLVLQQADGSGPELEMEAASYLFFSEGDYQAAYTPQPFKHLGCCIQGNSELFKQHAQSADMVGMLMRDQHRQQRARVDSPRVHGSHQLLTGTPRVNQHRRI